VDELFGVNNTEIFRGDLGLDIFLTAPGCFVVGAPSVLPEVLQLPSGVKFMGTQDIRGQLTSVWVIKDTVETITYYLNNVTNAPVRIVSANAKSSKTIEFMTFKQQMPEKSAFDVAAKYNCTKVTSPHTGVMMTKEELVKHFTFKPEFSLPLKAPVHQPMNSTNTTNVSLRIIPVVLIEVGKIVWKVIEDNRPSLDVKTLSNGVVPEGSTFSDMSGWQFSYYKNFQWKSTNGFGMTVVDFQWDFNWNCNGDYNGIGKYIRNAGAFPKSITVGWGYTVAVDAQMLEPLNIGTQQNPIASATIMLTMKISTIVKTTTQGCKVIMQGDCSSNLVYCDLYE